MRVLFLTDSLSDLDGVGRYTIRLVRALEALRPDLRVEVALGRKHRPTSADVPAHWRVRVSLPPDYFYYMSPARFWASAGTSLARVLPAARRADLVHAVKDFPHSLIGLWAARATGRPCVATAHGTYSVMPLLSERHAARARRAYAAFGAMIAVSRHTRERLLGVLRAGGHGADELERRLHVVPNAVDAEHYVERRALGPRPWHDVPYTLSIGQIKERKGHHLALGAWCRVAAERPGLHHFLVGQATGDAYERSLRERVEAAGLAQRVHFLGNVSEDEKVDLLQRALAFVHTPVTAADGGFEGFGIVYLEAAACGTPCLGTTESGAEDAVLDGRTGLLVPAREAQVAAALARLVDDADLRGRLAAGGREHARATTWEANARRVLAIYDGVLR